MTELYHFLKKSSAHLYDSSHRVAYGLDAIFVSNKAFLLVTKEDRIAVRIESAEFLRKCENTHQLTELVLNDKKVASWYLIPSAFNKKKNKLIPFIDLAYLALLTKDKRKKKKKVKKTISPSPTNILKNSHLEMEKLGLLAKIKSWF